MNEQTVVDLGAKSIWVAMQMAAPALIAILVSGIIISILQAATQIHEQTMSFVPKILAMTLALVVFGPWMLRLIMEFTIGMFRAMPGQIHGQF